MSSPPRSVFLNLDAPSQPSKRSRRNVDPDIPGPSEVQTTSNSFKKRNLSQGGLRNEGSSCALNAIVFSLHRAAILEYLVNIRDIVNVSDNTQDQAMVYLQDILRAMPNEIPFGTHPFIPTWNDSTRRNKNRPKIGKNDDILLGKHSLNGKIRPEGV